MSAGRKDDAKSVLERALNPAPGAITLVEKDGDAIVGAASYRFTDDGVKLCNIASLKKGVGSALFRRVLEKAVDGRVWCQSTPSAVGFYERLGLHRGEQLSDGRVIYRTWQVG